MTMEKDFEVTDVFCRSVTIERKNDSQYETEEECTVWLDGREILRSQKNVITIDGLKPDTEYQISLDSEKGAKSVRTKRESFLLSVRDFGACGDGSKLDTAAIQAAIIARYSYGKDLTSKYKTLIPGLSAAAVDAFFADLAASGKVEYIVTK